MRKILALFSPVVIEVRIKKEVINFAVEIYKQIGRVIQAFWHAILISLRAISKAFIFVIASLIKATKQVIYTILTFLGKFLNALVKLIRQLSRAILGFLRFTIVSLIKTIKQIIYVIAASLRFAIIGLIKMTKQIIKAILAFVHAILNSIRFVITSLIKIIKQVIHALVEIVKQFLHIIPAFFRFVASIVIGIYKQVVQVIRVFWNAILTSLRAISNAFIFVIASLVKIAKKVIKAILAFPVFVIIGLIEIIKQLFRVILAFPVFVLTTVVGIIKQIVRIILAFLRAILSSLHFAAASLAGIIKQFTSAVLNSCNLIISSLFRTKKQFIRGVAFVSIPILSSFSAGAVITGTVIAVVLASLVKINKKLIHGVVHAISVFLRVIPVSLRFVIIKARITRQLLRKVLTYYLFIVAGLIVVIAFVTATTYIQLAVAIALYPLLAFFAYKVFPRKARRVLSKKSAPAFSFQPPIDVNSAERAPTGKIENVDIADIDKRAFLKLIGGVGVFLFLFSIFNRRAEALLFKDSSASGTVALEDTAGKKIDPAQNQPVDGYNISEIEDSLISFYGYINKDGAWFVMRIDTNTGSFRYCRGDSNFPLGWENREKLRYDYFSNVF